MAAPASITLQDNIYDSAGNAVANAPVQVILNSNVETTSGGLIFPRQQSTTTDGNGFWSVKVVANDLLSPVNSTYTVITPFRTYDVAPQSANGSPQQSTAANVIVNTPSALAPATSNITGPLTITGTLTVGGLVTAQAGLTISGGTLSIPAGGFTMAGPLTLTAAASQIIPGATSFAVRDTGNAFDNLLVTNAGNLTIRGATLTLPANGTITMGINGSLVSGSDLFLQATGGTIYLRPTSQSQNNALGGGSGIWITYNGAGAQRNTLDNGSGGMVAAGGLTVSAGGLVVTAGNLTATNGFLVFSTATTGITAGPTSFPITNNAGNANNLLITDAGLVTLRNELQVPPSAGAALPTIASGASTVPVKLDDQSTASAASLTLTVPTGALYRTLEVEITGRSDQAGNQALLVQFNADVGANYDSSGINDTNATITALAPTVAGTSARTGQVVASGAAAGAVAAFHVVIENADSATLRKTWTYHGGLWATDAAASAQFETGQGQWRNVAAAITSIKLFPTAGNLVNARAILWGKS